MLEESIRVVVLAAFGVAMFFTLRKAFRLTGLIPYPPFESRAEYLVAALEMDLNEFVERAKATPMHVKWPEPPPPPLLMADTANQIVGILDLPTEDRIRRRNPFRGFRAPALGLPTPVQTSFGVPKAARSAILGPSGVAGEPAPAGASGGAGSPSPSSQATREPGKWYRVKETGELARACNCSAGCGCFMTFTEPLVYCLSNSVEPAYPRPDEWWDKKPCEKPHAGYIGAWQYGPSKWGRVVTADPADVWAKAAECGCLEPVNFGKGEDKKSGVA